MTTRMAKLVTTTLTVRRFGHFPQPVARTAYPLELPMALLKPTMMMMTTMTLMRDC